MDKNIVLFINTCPTKGVDVIRKKLNTDSLEIAVIGSSRKKKWIERAEARGVEHIIPADFINPESITRALLPYEGRILAATCRSEAHIPDFIRVIPHIPYLKTPTTTSLRWASDKFLMRQQFAVYNNAITPAFIIAKKHSADIKAKVRKNCEYPVIVKPAHLHSSLLVQKCATPKELDNALQDVFYKISSVYTQNSVDNKPHVVIEEYMDGVKYSIDGYVDVRGGVVFCPFIYNKTGNEAGFDDFFEYEISNRPTLSPDEKKSGKKVATTAVHALGLRNTSVHVELMLTKDGWKIIEVGARIGGFRQKLYKLSHNIDHAANDVRIRIPEPVKIPKKRKQYVGVFNFYPHKEGRLDKIEGIRKVQDLASFVDLRQAKQKGAMCRFAKNGGKKVLEIWLAHKDLGQWKKDVKKMEDLITIHTA